MYIYLWSSLEPARAETASDAKHRSSLWLKRSISSKMVLLPFFFFFLRVNKLLSTCHLGVIFARWSAEVSFPSLYLKIQHGIWVLGKLFSLTLKLCGTGKWKALPVPSTQDQYSCHGNLVLCSNSTWTVFGALVWSKEVLWPSRKSREVVWGFKMLLVHLLLNPGGFFA